MKKNTLSTRKGSQGFTLMEVLVALSISCLLIPGVLYTNFYLLSSTTNGANLNEAAAQARHFQQFFVQKINASGKNIRISDDGNIVVIELYDELSGQWDDGILAFNEDQHTIAYYTLDDHGDPEDVTTVANFVHRTETNKPVFSPVGSHGIVRCNLYVGRREPENREKTAGYFIFPGVFIDLQAAARNTGSIGASNEV